MGRTTTVIQPRRVVKSGSNFWKNIHRTDFSTNLAILYKRVSDSGGRAQCTVHTCTLACRGSWNGTRGPELVISTSVTKAAPDSDVTSSPVFSCPAFPSISYLRECTCDHMYGTKSYARIWKAIFLPFFSRLKIWGVL